MGADLDEAPRPFGRVLNRKRFVEPPGHRLLDVHVLTRRERIDAHRAVPVIGCGHDDGVDVLVLEQLAIVGVRLTLRAFGGHLRLAARRLPHVAHRNHVDVVAGHLFADQIAQVAAPHRVDADHAKVNTIVGANDPRVDGRSLERVRRDERSRDRQRGRSHRTFHEVPPRDAVRFLIAHDVLLCFDASVVSRARTRRVPPRSARSSAPPGWP